MSTNTGGSAFPSTQDQWERGMEGMTLRDWFAGQALAGMLADSKRTENLSDATNNDISKIAKINARWAYRLANAMIAAREKQE